MELELDDRRQYLKSYNEYPAVIEFNNSNNHALPQQQISQVITNNQNLIGDKIQKSEDFGIINNPNTKNSLVMHPALIAFATLFGTIIVFSGFILNDLFDNSTSRFFVIGFIIIIATLLFISYGMSINVSNKEKKGINCNSPNNQRENLNIDPDILRRLLLPNNMVICKESYNTVSDQKQKIIKVTLILIVVLLIVTGIGLFFSKDFIIIFVLILLLTSIFIGTNLSLNNNKNENNVSDYKQKIIQTSFVLPIILLSIIGGGLFLSHNPSKLFFESVMSIVIIFILILILISLLICINVSVRCNQLEYTCNNLTSFNNQIDNINHLDSRITENEKTIINNSLQLSGYNLNSSICLDSNELNLNEKTSSSFDGLLLFVYIIVLSFLIAYTIAVISSSLDSKPTFYILFISWIVSIFTLASIIYPWALNNNRNDVNILTGTISTIVPTIIFIIIFLISLID